MLFANPIAVAACAADCVAATVGFGIKEMFWCAGKEYPVKGEDFAFMLFRKRNCCVGY